MKTPASLMREHYPEAIKAIRKARDMTFEERLEFKGTAINPALSEKVLTMKELRK